MTYNRHILVKIRCAHLNLQSQALTAQLADNEVYDGLQVQSRSVCMNVCIMRIFPKANIEHIFTLIGLEYVLFYHFR
jgi:hypothetical protein